MLKNISQTSYNVFSVLFAKEVLKILNYKGLQNSFVMFGHISKFLYQCIQMTSLLALSKLDPMIVINKALKKVRLAKCFLEILIKNEDNRKTDS